LGFVLKLEDTLGHLLEAVGGALSNLDAPDGFGLLVHLAIGALGGELQTRIVVGDTHGHLLEPFGCGGFAGRSDLVGDGRLCLRGTNTLLP
jgi:hypothetical protein